jgi:hypothetical protein
LDNFDCGALVNQKVRVAVRCKHSHIRRTVSVSRSIGKYHVDRKLIAAKKRAPDLERKVVQPDRSARFGEVILLEQSMFMPSRALLGQRYRRELDRCAARRSSRLPGCSVVARKLECPVRVSLALFLSPLAPCVDLTADLTPCMITEVVSPSS